MQAPAAAPGPVGGWMPSSRVAAVAVMGMLAFGAEIGAVVGTSGVATLANAPLLLLRLGGSPPPAVTATALAGADGSASSGGGSASSGGGSAASGGESSRGGTQSSPSSQASPTASATATTTTAATPTTTTTSSSSTSTNPYGLPSIQHVFVIMLADQGYSQTFGSKDPYLAKTLPKQGKLIQWYYGVAGGELANQIALVSGQGPTQETAVDCPVFATIAPAGTSQHGQVLGHGCVYPRRTDTLGRQLTADHLAWKAYVQGMASSTPGQAQTCRHPVLGSADPDQTPRLGDPYVTWRNPFVYFHSVIDTSRCAHDDVDLTQLSTDLTNAATTPNLSYIVPDLCDDGSDQPCTPGGASGVAAADSFLRSVVPEIKSSAAYQAGGLIAITFDQAPQTGPAADPSACCATPKYPNLPSSTSSSSTTPSDTAPITSTPATTAPSTSPPSTSASAPTPTAPAPTTPASTTAPAAPTTASVTTTAPVDTTPSPTTTTSSSTPTPPVNLGGGQGQTSPTGGGGQIGLLLISPWVKPDTVDLIDYYNHFSLLASIEDIFNLRHLGYASQSGLPALDAGTFDGRGPSTG